MNWIQMSLNTFLVYFVGARLTGFLILAYINVKSIFCGQFCELVSKIVLPWDLVCPPKHWYAGTELLPRMLDISYLQRLSAGVPRRWKTIWMLCRFQAPAKNCLPSSLQAGRWVSLARASSLLRKTMVASIYNM